VTVTTVTKDAEARTLTLTAELDATVERAWRLFADPRQLEKWWNPPGYPLTIVDHDLSVGGFVRAFVISPEGEKVHAYWRITAVDAPRILEWEDGFLDDQGEPNADFPPSLMHLTLAERDGGGTLMTVLVTFVSAESMQWHLDMDLGEQMTQTFGQIDALLANDPD
jgi:uncharacterized protein YndB with AHSA1/START domain